MQANWKVVMEASPRNIDLTPGFLVELGDNDGLADRLAELAADPERRAQMGADGRARVLGRYAVERLIDDVDRLYRSLLDARAG